jgi:hypothetical protein
MISVDYPDLLKLFSQHLAPKRSESASFLIWFLENYYRLDTLEAIDSVCDQSGDKGVDGIYINLADNTIDVFQSRIHQKRETSVGDAALREFCGTLSQFRSIEALNNLVASAGDAEVASLDFHGAARSSFELTFSSVLSPGSEGQGGIVPPGDGGLGVEHTRGENHGQMCPAMKMNADLGGCGGD